MAYALASRLERAVKNAGVKYKKVSGWASRGHGKMGRIESIICHHTAGPASGNTPSLNVVAYGRPGLSGPLSQLFLARDGTVYLVAAGISYHAGRVSSNRYANSHAIGLEAEATGLDSWPAHQIEEYAKLCKALCKEFGLSVSRVQGHKEVAVPRGRKPDPNFNMSSFRAKVGGAKGGVSSSGGSTGGSSKKYESASAKHTVGSRVMGLYDGGTDVNWLQKQLGVKPADSLFGLATKKAVEAYQKSRKLAVDGLAGKATIGALQGSKAPSKPSTPKHSPKAPAFPFPKGDYMGVESNSKSNHSGYYAKDRPGIKLWQARMKKRGWTITADGYFGKQSQKVAKQFQKQVNVTQDGLVGAVTFEKAWSAPVT